LVSRDGAVEWLCFPRFDSPSVFGRLLDDRAGHFSVRPRGEFATSRRYLDSSMVLETTGTTSSGTVTIVDALALGPDRDQHQLGAGAPHLLIRRVECVTGQVDLDVEYAPRPEYGLITPLLSQVEGGVAARGGAEWLVFTSPAPLDLDAGTARGIVRMAAGDVLLFALQRTTLGDDPAHVWSQPDLQERLDGTVAAWQRWSREHQGYQGPWRELVHGSGRVLQALHYQPSRAVVAAATTSLPEGVGGERNWDYRFAWVRDASFTLHALWVAACPDEAGDFFAFMCTAAAGSLDVPDSALQIMFGIGGEHDLSERTLGHLGGWRDSRPVRVGNGAWSQQQVDVYGELLDAAVRLADRLGELDPETRAFLIACADRAAVKWREQDQGIWEQRGEPRDFLYSKVMCWVALDRAVALADRLGAADRVAGWRATRDEIRATVLREGWSEQAGAFSQYFGGTELDASNLMMPIVGFLPATDPRMKATIDAIAERLTDDRGLVYRYRTGNGANADGLSGEEGTFLLCTFWLAQAQAMAGELDAATATFERAAGYANDLGLLAEEVDGATGELLGNFPQAFSHIGLVNAAYAISEARAAASPPSQRHPAPEGATPIPLNS
jgi:GH15 family glucan-1,4-alpha-glucosidase